MPIQSNNNSNAFPIIKVALFAFLAIVAVAIFSGAVGRNDNQNWTVVQSVNGSIKIIDDGGYYTKWWGTTWTYPKYVWLEYTMEATPLSPGDDSIAVTFNDGGNAKMSTMIRVSTPTAVAQRIKFHQQLPDKDGSHYALRSAVKGHLVNCLKSSAPLMSASENQTARKAEYTQVVQEQLEKGLYEMKRVSRVLLDSTDSIGKPITVYATEVIVDEKTKMPIVSQVSPLTKMGIGVEQFSVTGTEYDDATKKQFATKKEAFLAAENSKAQREKEVQQRLMVEEKGLREKAEITAESNKALEAATITANQEKLVAETKAQQLVAVALQTKLEAETKAQQLVAVALQTKLEAETKASQEFEVSKLRRQTAEENGKAQILLAEAQKKSLDLAGAISEHDRVLAEIAAKRDVEVAAQLSKIATPNVVISGSGDKQTGGQDVTQQLINMQLLKSMNVIK